MWMRLKLLAKWHVKYQEFCEKMIHEELKLKNHWCGKLKCGKCKSFHTEFFERNMAEVRDTIEFWTAFFNRWNLEQNSI
jgi:hypothetical protein